MNLLTDSQAETVTGGGPGSPRLRNPASITPVIVVAPQINFALVLGAGSNTSIRQGNLLGLGLG